MGLRGALLLPDEQFHHGHTHGAAHPIGQKTGLVVTTLAQAPGGKGHRHQHIGIFVQSGTHRLAAGPPPQAVGQSRVGLVLDAHEQLVERGIVAVGHQTEGMLHRHARPQVSQHVIVIDAGQPQAGQARGTHGTQALLGIFQPALAHRTAAWQQQMGDIVKNTHGSIRAYILYNYSRRMPLHRQIYVFLPKQTRVCRNIAFAYA